MPLTSRGYDIASEGLARDIEKGDYTFPIAVGKIIAVATGLSNPITLIPTAIILGIKAAKRRNEKK